MKCPKCNSTSLSTIDSRACYIQNTTKRRRICIDCNNKFTTFEVIQSDEFDMVFAVRKTGSQYPLKPSGENRNRLQVNLDAHEMAALKKSLDNLYNVFVLR